MFIYQNDCPMRRVHKVTGGKSRKSPSQEDARIAARTIAGSNLVKAAIFGQDANWGRIICALGYSGAEFAPEEVDVYLGEL